MLKNLFETQRKYLNHFFENIDIEKSKKILNTFLECKGNIIFTGVGKSGIIAQKIATTMLSTGTKAFYLSSVDALHGDMGMISEKDLFVILSKSGESKELIQLIPHVNQKKAKIISIVSNKNSKLAKLSDLYISLPVKKEICPFNLAPTTSAAVQLLFGDILTVALMKNKNFSLDDYAVNHPYGSIGKKITLKVEQLMLKGKNIPLCFEKDLLVDVIDVLSSKRCGCLIVVDEKFCLKGIFTDGDLRRAIEGNRKTFLYKKIKDLMTVNPKTVLKDALAWDAMKEMERNGKLVTVLPVLEGKKVIGIIRMHDIIQEGLGE
jgi:arabinose-5-phosphate isomerase